MPKKNNIYNDSLKHERPLLELKVRRILIYRVYITLFLTKVDRNGFLYRVYIVSN